MKKAAKTSVFRFAYIGITVLVIVLIGIFDSNFQDMGKALRQINLAWILGGVVCMVAYLLTDGWLLQYITNNMTDDRLSFPKSLKIGIVGLYYSALTPSSSGGQPFQILYMKREKISVGAATCVVLIKFVTFASTVLIFFALSWLVLGSSYIHSNTAVYWLAVTGCVLYVVALTLFILTVVNETWVLRAGSSIINFLHRAKIIKTVEKLEKAKNAFTKIIEDYNGTAKYLKNNIGKMVIAVFISLVNIGFLFAVTFFIYRAFGLQQYTFIFIMALQAFLYTAVSYFPLPGAAGASEGGFYAIFSAFFPKDLVFMALLIWRIMTYYIMLALGSLVVVLDEFFSLRKNKNNPDTAGEISDPGTE
jgi:hypothetical protein